MGIDRAAEYPVLGLTLLWQVQGSNLSVNTSVDVVTKKTFSCTAFYSPRVK